MSTATSKTRPERTATSFPLRFRVLLVVQPAEHVPFGVGKVILYQPLRNPMAGKLGVLVRLHEEATVVREGLGLH
jgi:hypothetical protein